MEDVMIFETYGDKTKPVALLIHCIFYPGASNYRGIIPYLEKGYYVVVPRLEGLDYPHHDFTSRVYQADKIVSWLKENKIDHIGFLLGASFGAAVAFEILKELWLKIDVAVLDAPALKQSKVRGMFFYMELKKLVKEFKTRGMKVFDNDPRYKYVSMSDKEYILNVYKNLDNDTIKKLSFSCYDYTLPSAIYRPDTKIKFLFGEKDKAKMNLPEIKNLHSGEIKIIEGMDHMQYIFDKPKDYLNDCGLNVCSRI